MLGRLKGCTEETAGEDRERKRRDCEIADARPGRHDFVYLRRDAAGHLQDVEPDAQGRYHSEVVPGFWIDPNWFWQDLTSYVKRLTLEIAPRVYRRYLAALLAEATEE